MSGKSNNSISRIDPRYHSLDIWRGVACLMVVVLHAIYYARPFWTAEEFAAAPIGSAILSVISRMGAGVCMFFVISGYCIAATSQASVRRGDTPKDFFIRRFRRIFPPFWAAFVLTALVVLIVYAAGGGAILNPSGAEHAVIPHPSQLSLSQWLGNITLTEHWRYHLIGSDELKLIGPAWSLSYEEQFYAVCGVILVLAPRRFFHATWMVSLFTIIVLIAGPSVESNRIGGFFFDGRWLLFAIGVLIYYHVNIGAAKGNYLTPIVIVLAAIAAIAIRYAWLKDGTFVQKSRAFEYVVGTLFGVVLLAMHRWDQPFSRLRLLQPIAWCGTMCYSLYLIHWPVTNVAASFLAAYGIRSIWATLLVTVPVCIILSLAASWGFYLLVERRFLNTSSRKVKQPAYAPAGVVAAEAVGGTA